MTISPFPHYYSAILEGDMLLAGARTPIQISAPSQFGGGEDAWSPEQLLVAAALTCFKTTFDAYARREHITVLGWRGIGRGTLVKGHAGPIFDNIELEVDIVTEAGDEARTQAIVASAERNCIIARSLNAPVHVKSTVTAAPSAAAM